MPEPTKAPDVPQEPTASFVTAEGSGAEPAAEAEFAPSVERAGRYVLLEEVGRGGMGCVRRARDPELGRDLAVKLLLKDTPEHRARFLAEARTTGRLQHPGVAPVLDAGRLPDGRPYFAMKLVQGRTLADLLKERPAPAHDLMRFLAVFEQVCQTLAYAHSRRVLHRDLKPGNVMVGVFGEVQVMDWGLAKVLSREGPRDGTAAEGGPKPLPETVTEVEDWDAGGPGLATRGGWGTPAYMAPEQARGKWERLDQRADVFGLGAVLCDILTGRPPFAAETAERSRWKAMCGDLADAFA